MIFASNELQYYRVWRRQAASWCYSWIIQLLMFCMLAHGMEGLSGQFMKCDSGGLWYTCNNWTTDSPASYFRSWTHCFTTHGSVFFSQKQLCYIKIKYFKTISAMPQIYYTPSCDVLVMITLQDACGLCVLDLFEYSVFRGRNIWGIWYLVIRWNGLICMCEEGCSFDNF